MDNSGKPRSCAISGEGRNVDKFPGFPQEKTDKKGSTGNGKKIGAYCGKPAGEREVTIRGLTIGQIIGAAEDVCQAYLARHGGTIDYIHNDETAVGMGRRADGAAGRDRRLSSG